MHQKIQNLKPQLRAFSAGFVLGAAFLASPAIGLLLSLIATAYLIYATQGHRA